MKNEYLMPKVIAEIGCNHKGKTYIAEDLAIVSAYVGKRTLLIGADLRKPKIYSDFNLKNNEYFYNSDETKIES